MKQRRRIYYNAQQRALIWARYQQGESLHDIAKFFDRGHSSIQGILVKTGGIRPPAKKRAPSSLTAQEREEISRGISSQLSIREIAKQLNRAPSTISRTIIKTPIIINRKTIFSVARYHRCLVNSAFN